MIKWKYAQVMKLAFEDSDELTQYLDEGWEPFAITSGGNGVPFVHLRKQTGVALAPQARPRKYSDYPVDT